MQLKNKKSFNQAMPLFNSLFQTNGLKTVMKSWRSHHFGR